MPVDLDAIRKRHWEREYAPEADITSDCDECEEGWPCDAIQLADEIERLWEEEKLSRSAISRQIEVNGELREALEEIKNCVGVLWL